MPETPTISIVTPSYNQDAYLEDTIKSVISQQGDFYIDYIIIDGGSTDSSVDIIKRYEQILKNGEWKQSCRGIRFRWVSEKDNGQTHAINKGFEIAKGEILSWINSDDMYSPNSFATVMNHFTMNPNDDFLYGDGDVIDENGIVQWEWLSRPYNYNLMKSYHFLWNDFTNYIMQQATFWRKRVSTRIGMLDESFHYAMDVEYWIRAGSANLRLAHIPKKLGQFRLITGTKSLSSPTIFWPDMLEIFRKYNGAKHMTPFLAYYYYNEAIHNNFDVEKAWEDTKKIFTRWEHVETDEKLVLYNKAKWGFGISCLITMNAAYNAGNKQASYAISKKIGRDYPTLLFHPLYVGYRFKLIIGYYMSTRLQGWLQACISKYRKVRYQSRYSNRSNPG